MKAVKRKKAMGMMAVLAALTICLSACGSSIEDLGPGDRFVDLDELLDSEAAICNDVSGSGHISGSEWRMHEVTEQETLEAIAPILEKAEIFRPITTADTYVGDPEFNEEFSGPYASWMVFQGTDYEYIVWLPDASEQLSTDYIYRDEPALAIVRRTEDGEQAYYCFLTAYDYSVLYTVMNRYVSDFDAHVTYMVD